MRTVTQSFIKRLFSYKKGDICGYQFYAQYEEGVEFPPSDAMRLGQWFEYTATGQRTKFGHIPMPDRNKPKKLTQKEEKAGKKQEDVIGELSKKYKDALIQVEAFKKMLEANDYEIVSTGERLRDDRLGIEGDVDLIVRKRGEEKVRFIDIKFSGLLDNKWEEMGWADESLSHKDNIMIQAVHYKILGKAKYGYYPEFYFWVFSSQNTTDRKNIRVNVNPERYAEHLIIIGNARKQFEKYQELGWKPKPQPKECAKCPLKEACSHYVELPIEQVVDY